MSKSLNKIIQMLESIDEDAIIDGVSHHYIDARINGKEIVIGANKEGLIYLAMSLLELSKKTADGSHIHFDSGSMLDNSDVQLVFTKIKPDWS